MGPSQSTQNCSPDGHFSEQYLEKYEHGYELTANYRRNGVPDMPSGYLTRLATDAVQTHDAWRHTFRHFRFYRVPLCMRCYKHNSIYCIQHVSFPVV